MTTKLPAVMILLITGVYACGSSSDDGGQQADEHAAHADAGAPAQELPPPSPLDHPISQDSTATESSSALQAACADGDNYCNGTADRCIACCHGTWYDINYCLYGVNFYCNGYRYNAYNCWPIAAPQQ